MKRRFLFLKKTIMFSYVLVTSVVDDRNIDFRFESSILDVLENVNIFSLVSTAIEIHRIKIIFF